jgi:hypothetical protein
VPRYSCLSTDRVATCEEIGNWKERSIVITTSGELGREFVIQIRKIGINECADVSDNRDADEPAASPRSCERASAFASPSFRIKLHNVITAPGKSAALYTRLVLGALRGGAIIKSKRKSQSRREKKPNERWMPGAVYRLGPELTRARTC